MKPSKGFDVLASDFQKPVLVATILGLVTLISMVGSYMKKKQLNEAWA